MDSGGQACAPLWEPRTQQHTLSEVEAMLPPRGLCPSLRGLVHGYHKGRHTLAMSFKCEASCSFGTTQGLLFVFLSFVFSNEGSWGRRVRGQCRAKDIQSWCSPHGGADDEG